MTPRDFAVGAYIHSCWVAFVRLAPSEPTLTCGGLSGTTLAGQGAAVALTAEGRRTGAHEPRRTFLKGISSKSHASQRRSTAGL
jgi:hypothetical protein